MCIMDSFLQPVTEQANSTSELSDAELDQLAQELVVAISDNNEVDARDLEARRILPNGFSGLLPILKKVASGFFKGAVGKRNE
jgi:hypothetical protein